MFQKAQRTQSKLRLGLIGPSGSGKTYSALRIAQGLGGRIALLDSERGSGSLYADLANYDVAELTPPYSPEKYVQAIKQAGQAGYDVLIIDSLTHAWAGEGGILEFVDKASQATRNNFAAWREASPKHNALVDALLGAPLHIIATIRSKTAWDVVKDEKTGKTRPVKIGLAPVQRDGLEYEFTTVLELSVDGHIATATKDRTGLFDGSYFNPTEETGQMLKAWLGGGQTSATPSAPISNPETPRATPEPQPLTAGNPQPSTPRPPRSNGDGRAKPHQQSFHPTEGEGLPPLTDPQRRAIFSLGQRNGYDEDYLDVISVNTFGRGVNALTVKDASSFIQQLQKAA
ncbi:AAA domain-containing protein [Desulfonatronum zhilinae]|nr:AAA domain-containing protein [Desulfonatronum zhilinae]